MIVIHSHSNTERKLFIHHLVYAIMTGIFANMFGKLKQEVRTTEVFAC